MFVASANAATFGGGGGRTFNIIGITSLGKRAFLPEGGNTRCAWISVSGDQWIDQSNGGGVVTTSSSEFPVVTGTVATGANLPPIGGNDGVRLK